MKIGAYQFSVSGDLEKNFKEIKSSIVQASKNNVRLLVFPECALTGYPPINIKSCKDIDLHKLDKYIDELKELAIKHNINLIIGSIIKERDNYYNSAIVISSKGEILQRYDKRALWGWDKENFQQGNELGVVKIDKYKVGIRICYEIRFPEYFRELYKCNTDLNIILFNDVSSTEDLERYEIIKAHLRTRAVENVTTTISVNSINPYQTAPTAIFKPCGKIDIELERNSVSLLIYDYDVTSLSYSDEGKKRLSDVLIEK